MRPSGLASRIWSPAPASTAAIILLGKGPQATTLDVMPQAYADALRDRPTGSVGGPFQTEGGWAVLRVEDRRRETPPTLEQARPQIVRYLTYEGVRQLLEQLRGKAEVDVLLPADTPSAPRPSAPAPAA